MAYDLEEQEQLADLKAFWNKYGNLLTWVLIAVLGSYAAYNYWNYHQRTQAADASVLYDELQRSLNDKDNAKVQRIAADVENKFGSTTYGAMAALAAAKGAFDANDLKTAKTQLQWAIDHGNAEYKSIAKLRLAGVLLDEKAYDDGLKLLAGDFLPQFAGPVADRKGDFFVAQNKLAEARTAYQAALSAMDGKNPGRRLVELKLESIGGTAGGTAGAAAPAPKSPA
jgi:predicted negative regulator of RcsB-dependent stress response